MDVDTSGPSQMSERHNPLAYKNIVLARHPDHQLVTPLPSKRHNPLIVDIVSPQHDTLTIQLVVLPCLQSLFPYLVVSSASVSPCLVSLTVFVSFTSIYVLRIFLCVKTHMRSIIEPPNRLSKGRV